MKGPTRLQDLFDNIGTEIEAYEEYRELPKPRKDALKTAIKQLQIMVKCLMPRAWKEGR